MLVSAKLPRRSMAVTALLAIVLVSSLRSIAPNSPLKSAPATSPLTMLILGPVPPSLLLLLSPAALASLL